MSDLARVSTIMGSPAAFIARRTALISDRTIANRDTARTSPRRQYLACLTLSCNVLNVRGRFSYILPHPDDICSFARCG
jgi:hypothetical protein